MSGTFAAPVYASPTLGNPTETSANFDAALSAYESGQFTQALSLAKTAAQGGSTDAAVMAGHILRKGQGMDVDLTEARRWYNIAAVKGHPDSLVALGEMGIRGQAGLTRADAVSYLTRASDMGRTDAMRALADLYRMGDGVQADTDRSKELLTKASQSYDAEAAKALGDQLFESDPKTALKHYETAATAGHVEAAYIAGLMYAENFEIRPDARLSAKWLRQAAEGGHAAAQADYGLLVYQGVGTVSSESEAATWFEKSAKGGDTEGQFLYAFTLAKGEGVAQNFGDAYYWVLKSIESAKSAGIDMYDNDREVLRKRLEDNVNPSVLSAARSRL